MLNDRFSRRKKKAARKEVSNLIFDLGSGGGFSPDNKLRRGYYRQQERAKKKAFSRLKIVALIIGILFVATGVSMAFYFYSQMQSSVITDSSVLNELSPAEDNVEYVLLAGDFAVEDFAVEDGEALGASAANPSVKNNPTSLFLMRVDNNSQAMSLMAIPSNLLVELSDGETHRVADASSMNGDGALVNAVASALEVPITQFSKIDKHALVRLVDALGGVSISSAKSGDTRNISGEEALVIAQTKNDSENQIERMKNNGELIRGVFACLLEGKSGGILGNAQLVVQNIKSTFNLGDYMYYKGRYKNSLVENSTFNILPTHSYVSDKSGVEYSELLTQEWQAQKSLFMGGKASEIVDSKQQSIDPGSFTITVRNGGGVEGAASKFTDAFKKGGFNVTVTDNASTYAYDETLIIYQDKSLNGKAEAVRSYLEIGRSVLDYGYYTYDSDILVVLGSDIASYLD